MLKAFVFRFMSVCCIFQSLHDGGQFYRMALSLMQQKTFYLMSASWVSLLCDVIDFDFAWQGNVYP